MNSRPAPRYRRRLVRRSFLRGILLPWPDRGDTKRTTLNPERIVWPRFSD